MSEGLNEEEKKLQALNDLITQTREDINQKIGFLLDHNATATVVLRNQAKNFETIAEFYQEMRDRSIDIASDIATLCRLSSDLAGDIISAEFSEELIDDDNEEEEDG